MDSPQTWSRRAGLTPGKLALVGVLTAILIGVIARRFGNWSGNQSGPVVPQASSEPPARHVASRTKPKTARPAAAIVDTTLSTRSGEYDQTQLPAPDLATVVQYDPFALPAKFPQPAQIVIGAADAMATAKGLDAESESKRMAETLTRLQTDLEQLKQRGANVIVRERDQYVALIGDRTIHVGDEINGFTVTAIEPDGVHVERKIEP